MIISLVLNQLPKLKHLNLITNSTLTNNQKDLAYQMVRENYSNGLSKYLEKLRIEVVDDYKKCKMLWQLFSPQKSLFDTWEFRNAFHKGYNFKPKFVTISKNDNVVACLPLCFNSQKPQHEWFGTSWQEDNKFYSLDPYFVPILLYFAPRPLSLYAILEQEKNKIPFITFENDDPKYFLDLKQTSSLENYLSSLKKKKRYNLKRDWKKIVSQHPMIYYNRYEDFDEMVCLAIKRFNTKGEMADWQEDPQSIKTFKHILREAGKSYSIKMITVKINNEPAAIDIAAIFDKGYYPLTGANNIVKFPGIGTFINMLEIEDAINMGMEKVDFLQADYGWKDKWFKGTPLYQYKII